TARALFGEVPVRGHLPVTIPGPGLQAGFGLELPADPMRLQAMDVRREEQLRPAFQIVEEAIADKVTPGGSVAIGYGGKILLHAFGNLSYAANSAGVDTNTMYDIASLTKVVVTATLAAKLSEGDFPVPLDLDARIERYLPEWASGPQLEWRHQVTVRH